MYVTVKLLRHGKEISTVKINGSDQEWKAPFAKPQKTSDKKRSKGTQSKKAPLRF